MVVKQCTACGSVWSSELSKCPWCGGSSADQPAPAAVLQEKQDVPRKETANVPPRPSAGPASPSFLSKLDGAEESDQIEAEGPDIKVPPEGEEDDPAPEEEIEFPSATAPATSQIRPAGVSWKPTFWFGLLALLGVGALPASVWYETHVILGLRVGVVGLWAAAALALAGPLAWIYALKHERVCAIVGAAPSFGARAGRFLGVVCTFAVAIEFAGLLVLLALYRSWERIPPTFFRAPAP